MNHRAAALRDAMVNEEEPSVAREDLDEGLDFLRDCFNYQVIASLTFTDKSNTCVIFPGF